ncbi:MAG TPA: SH3 domain-containing protein, partial [Chloroflexota bacterium]|nr:SH3 domain-containing protein [Chloroflexota bacterium]
MQLPRPGMSLWIVLLVVALALARPNQASATGDLAVGGGASVTADWLNVRGGPGTDNPIVGQLAYGTVLRLIAGPVNDTWWRVTDGQQVGYVSDAWLATSDGLGNSSVFDVDVAVPVHRQMTRVWCDPADLQSWVELDTGQSLGDATAVQQQF